MRPNTDTISRNSSSAGTSSPYRQVGGWRTLRRSRGVPYKLEHILFAGIVGFAVGISIIHSRLMKAESIYTVHDLRRDSTRNGSSGQRRERAKKWSEREVTMIGPNGDIPSDYDHPLHKNNNHLNPGRAYGSERGKIKCDQDIYRITSYWNDPRSYVDRLFESPFLEAPSSSYITKPKKARYLSFEPDLGGWNNIRMEFEIMVVLAAATGRILVMPPDNPLYLLYKDKDNRHRGLQKFFQPFDDVVETISTEEFFKREMIGKKTYPLPKDPDTRKTVMDSLEKCNWMAKAENSCIQLYEYMSSVADFVPEWHGEHHCLIMDDKNWHKDSFDVDGAQKQQVKKFCDRRQSVYYNKEMHDAPLIHFHSHHKDTRLLVHYYAFIHFTSPKIGNYYKRLVRDRVRYSDEIFCAAGKIIYSLINESIGRYFNGAGAEAGYYSMHIRRGDFQWPKMKLSAEEWHENTKHWLGPDDEHLLYIATDETDRTFFAPLMKHYKVRFLSDYAELAGLSDLDPNYVGMIDQVVASRGRDFVGTYFSSFSAYIGRMRGYYNLSGKRMFYSHPDYWNQTHSFVYPHSSYSAREFPLGWVGIDEDEEPSAKNFY